MDNSTVALFTSRRQRFLRLSMYIAGMMAVSFAAMIIMLEMKLPDSVVMFGFIGFFLSVVAWIFMVYAVYRCPACEKVPMVRVGMSVGVDFNPTTCRSCGVVLQEEKESAP